MKTKTKLRHIFYTFWFNLRRLLDPFWKPFGKQKAIHIRLDFWVQIWRRERARCQKGELSGVPAPDPYFPPGGGLGEARSQIVPQSWTKQAIFHKWRKTKQNYAPRTPSRWSAVADLSSLMVDFRFQIPDSRLQFSVFGSQVLDFRCQFSHFRFRFPNSACLESLWSLNIALDDFRIHRTMHMLVGGTHNTYKWTWEGEWDQFRCVCVCLFLADSRLNHEILGLLNIITNSVLELSGFRLQITIQISAFTLQNSTLGFQISDPGFQIFRFPNSEFRSLISDVSLHNIWCQFRSSDFRIQNSDFGIQVPALRFQNAGS